MNHGYQILMGIFHTFLILNFARNILYTVSQNHGLFQIQNDRQIIIADTRYDFLLNLTTYRIDLKTNTIFKMPFVPRFAGKYFAITHNQNSSILYEYETQTEIKKDSLFFVIISLLFLNKIQVLPNDDLVSIDTKNKMVSFWNCDLSFIESISIFQSRLKFKTIVGVYEIGQIILTLF